MRLIGTDSQAFARRFGGTDKLVMNDFGKTDVTR